MKIFEIAQNKKEANELVAEGFGYETKEDAKRALEKAKVDLVDYFYHSKLKVFECTLSDENTTNAP